MLAEKRQALPERQHQMVVILTLPDQSEAEHLALDRQPVRIVAKGLAIKRWREALACWPALPEVLGSQDPQLFRELAIRRRKVRPTNLLVRHYRKIRFRLSRLAVLAAPQTTKGEFHPSTG